MKVVWKTHYLTTTTGLTAAFGVDVTNDADRTIDLKLVGFLGDPTYVVPAVDDEANITDTVLTTDQQDVNSNGSNTKKVVTTGASYVIATTNHLQVVGTIADAQGTDWGQTVTLSPNGIATIHLTTGANSDETFQQLYGLDELPSLGDLGITDGTDRDSNFTVSLMGPITLPASWQGKVQVAYTTT
ncbi:putative cell wall surface anchor family protein [Secundilactobacillus oryzae JCM 18671]|uniref:Putative cell wall surface anchor family protein n=1 Tax=Secundilactobacillus oryzae JCM 18671 TaxID=1291743 RepID=A0A081BIF1_9LACO|nr:hypothetical protein [Secundilactobacillus oryzae]GAK47819.1 putative cell wall surface anchor family protein [Secundilactobacillus oryzae JCM 18671]